MEYTFLCCILALSSYSKSKLICILNTVLIFIFLSGAYSYGYDWIRYREYYEQVFKVADISTWLYEPGFSLILLTTKLLKLDYQWVVVICSFILCANICNYALKKKSINFCLFFVFSVFGFMEFAEQIRQGVAISFVLLSVNYLLEKSNKKFALFVFFASMFHASAIICLAFAPLLKILTKKNAKLKALIFTILGFIAVWGFKLFILNIGSFGFSGFIATKLQGYATSDGSDSGVLSAGLILNLAVIFIALLSTQTHKAKHFCSVIFSFFVIQSKAVSIAYRFSYYGYSFIYEAFEWLYTVKNGRNFNKIILLMVLLVFCFKPLLNPVYRAMFDDYHSFWLGIFTEQPDIINIRNERCATLIENGIKYCSN